jgi:hypothetical protein
LPPERFAADYRSCLGCWTDAYARSGVVASQAAAPPKPLTSPLSTKRPRSQRCRCNAKQSNFRSSAKYVTAWASLSNVPKAHHLPRRSSADIVTRHAARLVSFANCPCQDGKTCSKPDRPSKGRHQGGRAWVIRFGGGTASASSAELRPQGPPLRFFAPKGHLPAAAGSTSIVAW